MNEHHWKFKVGSNRFDQYRATTATASPSVQVLHGEDWHHWTGEPVAAEILRLAGGLHLTQIALADFILKERELLNLADELDPGECSQCQGSRSIAEHIRSILRLPE